jgi:hypothetical protein
VLNGVPLKAREAYDRLAEVRKVWLKLSHDLGRASVSVLGELSATKPMTAQHQVMKVVFVF